MNKICQAIVDEIKQLEQDLKTAPSTKKAAFKEAIKQAKINLKKCIAKHPK
jgi:hypothetical protein